MEVGLLEEETAAVHLQCRDLLLRQAGYLLLQQAGCRPLGTGIHLEDMVEEI